MKIDKLRRGIMQKKAKNRVNKPLPQGDDLALIRLDVLGSFVTSSELAERLYRDIPPKSECEDLEQYLQRVFDEVSTKIYGKEIDATKVLVEERKHLTSPLLRSFCDDFKDRYLANQYERP
jgi:hypothetical protein